ESCEPTYPTIPHIVSTLPPSVLERASATARSLGQHGLPKPRRPPGFVLPPGCARWVPCLKRAPEPTNLPRRTFPRPEHCVLRPVHRRAVPPRDPIDPDRGRRVHRHRSGMERERPIHRDLKGTLFPDRLASLVDDREPVGIGIVRQSDRGSRRAHAFAERAEV